MWKLIALFAVVAALSLTSDAEARHQRRSNSCSVSARERVVSRERLVQRPLFQRKCR